jgi:hypothetical protein
VRRNALHIAALQRAIRRTGDRRRRGVDDVDALLALVRGAAIVGRRAGANDGPLLGKLAGRRNLRALHHRSHAAAIYNRGITEAAHRVALEDLVGRAGDARRLAAKKDTKSLAVAMIVRAKVRRVLGLTGCADRGIILFDA